MLAGLTLVIPIPELSDGLLTAKLSKGEGLAHDDCWPEALIDPLDLPVPKLTVVEPVVVE